MGRAAALATFRPSRGRPSVLHSLLGCLLSACLFLLAGCASDPQNLPLGTTRNDALQRLGRPTATYPMPNGGERLQYSLAPFGFTVTNVDVDAAGRVVSVVQELQEGLFDSTIKVNAWRVDDILRTYGKPYEITRVYSFDGNIWSWRFLSINNPRWLYIYVDPQGLVVRYQTADQLRRDLFGI